MRGSVVQRLPRTTPSASASGKLAAAQATPPVKGPPPGVAPRSTPHLQASRATPWYLPAQSLRARRVHSLSCDDLEKAVSGQRKCSGRWHWPEKSQYRASGAQKASAVLRRFLGTAGTPSAILLSSPWIRMGVLANEVSLFRLRVSLFVPHFV
jgi:hypothetical protein